MGIPLATTTVVVAELLAKRGQPLVPAPLSSLRGRSPTVGKSTHKHLTEGDQRFYSSTGEPFLREARDVVNGGRLRPLLFKIRVTQSIGVGPAGIMQAGTWRGELFAGNLQVKFGGGGRRPNLMITHFDSYTIPEDDPELGQSRLLEVDNRVVVPAKTHLRMIVTPADVPHSWAVLPQVSNVMLYLVVQIRPPFRYNEKEFTMVSAVRFVN
ncbi:hypothetical protein ACMD2_14403 [Ananas comosus]|uniref:Cytochrome c oxidase polypeptide II n=1 Tax=Ananas comosus TaxID=4615 RepID=A0A199UDV3_ANACO|nr:hypothetical protein ACMD2_14403 [Ananas comosus]